MTEFHESKPEAPQNAVHIRLSAHNIVDKSDVCLCGLNIECMFRSRNCGGDVNTKTIAFTKLVLLLREV